MERSDPIDKLPFENFENFASPTNPSSNIFDACKVSFFA